MIENNEEIVQGQPTIAPSTPESTPEANQVAATQERDVERNFKALRESKQKVERERDEAVKRIQELQQQSLGKQQSTKTIEEENELMLNPDDLVEGKHLSYFQKKIKQLEKQVNQYQQTSTESTVEIHLKNQYPDFDKVVSKENVELLRDVAPELAQSINSNPDLLSKAKAAYLMIKKMGIYQEDKYVDDKNKAIDNLAKPKPLAAVSPQQGESPLSRANAFAHGLTDELKTQLRREMNEARKNS